MRRRDRAGLLTFAALALATIASTAHAAEPSGGLGLNWVRASGAESCVTGTELMNVLESRTGKILFVRNGDAALTIDGYVQPIAEPAGWSLTLELTAADGKVLGRRQLDAIPGNDCSAVTEVAEFVIDLTRDPDGRLNTGIPLDQSTLALLDKIVGGEPVDPQLPQAGPPAPRPPPAPRTTQERRARREPRSPREATTAGERAAVGAGVSGALGVLPDAALGASVHASVPTAAGVRLELQVTLFPDAKRREAFDRADFGLLLGTLALCPLEPLRGLWLCAGGEYGSQSVEPSALPSSRPATRPLGDVLAYGVLRVGLLGPLQAHARLGVFVPLVRNAYRYDSPTGDVEMYRTPAAGARADLGLGLEL